MLPPREIDAQDYNIRNLDIQSDDCHDKTTLDGFPLKAKAADMRAASFWNNASETDLHSPLILFRLNDVSWVYLVVDRIRAAGH